MNKITKKVQEYFKFMQDNLSKNYKGKYKSPLQIKDKKERDNFFSQVKKLWSDKHKKAAITPVKVDLGKDLRKEIEKEVKARYPESTSVEYVHTLKPEHTKIFSPSLKFIIDVRFKDKPTESFIAHLVPEFGKGIGLFSIEKQHKG